MIPIVYALNVQTICIKSCEHNIEKAEIKEVELQTRESTIQEVSSSEMDLNVTLKNPSIQVVNISI